MKKILLTAILAAPFMGYAGEMTSSSTNDALTGFLLGIEGGFQRADYSQKLTTVTGSTSARSNVKNPSYDFTGVISLGYFKNQDGLYYGAKFSAGKNLSQRSKKATDGGNRYNSIQTKVDAQYSLALVGQVGTYVCPNSVVYGLLGVKRIRYDLNITATPVAPGAKVDGNAGKSVWGPVVGIGFKKTLTDQWAFNTELSYERYKNINSGNADAVNATKIGTSIKPQVWNVTVGISHKF